MLKRVLPSLAVAFAVTACAARGDVITFSNLAGHQIETFDTSTGVITPLFDVPGQPAGLVYFGTNILVALQNTGQIVEWNGSTVSVIASGMQTPGDLALHGNTLYISDSGSPHGNKVYQLSGLDTVSPALSILDGNIDDPHALQYVNGHLFVADTTVLYEINPLTGAVEGQLLLGVNLGGMVYDPFTGKIFLADQTHGALIEFSFNNSPAPGACNATGAGACNIGTPAFVSPPISGPNPLIEGITSDGAGLIYLAVRVNNVAAAHVGAIWEYNIVTNNFSKVASKGPAGNVPGVEDLVDPPTPNPEPAAVMLMAAGLLVLAIRGQATKFRNF